MNVVYICTQYTSSISVHCSLTFIDDTANVAAKTRQQLSSKFVTFVGNGKEFCASELPTVRSCLQKGILIKEQHSIQEDKSKFHPLSVHEIATKLAPLVLQQWQRANAKFLPPVTIKVINRLITHSITFF